MAGHRALLTVVLTDAVGFSALASHDEEAALNELDADFVVIRAAVAAHGGQVVKSTGDGLLITFDIPGQALDCMLEVQTQFASREPGSLEHRVGIHLCEVVRDDTDIHGDGVNLAARLQAEASPGSIAISQTVYDIVKSRLSIEPKALGERRLKNFSEPVTVFEVAPHNAPKRRSTTVYRKSNWAQVLGIAAVAASILVLSGVIWTRFGNPVVHELGGVTINRYDTKRPASEVSAPTKPMADPRLVAAAFPPTAKAIQPKVVAQPASKPASTPSAPVTTIAANPVFLTGPKVTELQLQRRSMLRNYDFQGMAKLYESSPDLNKLPVAAKETASLSSLIELRSLVDAYLKSASDRTPIAINLKRFGTQIPIGVFGSLDSGLTVVGLNGSKETRGPGKIEVGLFRPLAVQATQRMADRQSARRMLEAFDAEFSLRQRQNQLRGTEANASPFDDGSEVVKANKSGE